MTWITLGSHVLAISTCCTSSHSTVQAISRVHKPFSCNKILRKQVGRRAQAVSIYCGSGQPQPADHLQPTDNQEGAAASLLGSQSITPQGTPRWLELLAVGSLVCSVVFGAIPAPLAQASTRLTADERETIELFKESTSSVVYITNLASRRDAFTLDMLAIPQGAGSGFVWDNEGHIVTNLHVVRDATIVQVTLKGGDEYMGSLVGIDEDKDIAVLKIDVPKEVGVHPLKLGSSSDLLVGQRVFAIGNPFGLDHTLTTGVISGTGREIASGNTGRPIQDVIQTDAAINPGNSGGPLLDSGGSLIGINTAIYSPSGANTGIGFAVPVDVVRSSVSQIIKYGRVVRPIMGIAFAPDQSVEQLGVTGILVLDARGDGPAGLAGIQGTKRDSYGRLVLGDIIVSMDGARIKTASDLYRQLDKCTVGQTVDLEVLRQDAKEHISVTLASNFSTT